MKNKRLIIGCVVVVVLLLCVSIFAVGEMRFARAQRLRNEFDQTHVYDPEKQSQAADALSRQRPLADPMMNLMQMLHGMMGVEPPPQASH